MRISLLPSLILCTPLLFAQVPDAGKKLVDSSCARCHGADGNGGEMGPAIRSRLRARDDQQLITLIRNGLPAPGMPPTRVADPDLNQLIAHLRRLQRRERPVEQRKVELVGGGVLEGQLLGEGFAD